VVVEYQATLGFPLQGETPGGEKKRSLKKKKGDPGGRRQVVQNKVVKILNCQRAITKIIRLSARQSLLRGGCYPE